jgi:hypothetical protein
MDNLTLRNKSILLISPEPWGKIRLSKHHYATELAKHNTVFFLNPFSNTNNIRELQPNLTVVDYKGIKGLNRIPNILSNLFQKKLIKKIQSLCKVNRFDVVWNFDPYSFQNQRLWKSNLAIYHAMDHHKTNLEKSLASSSDFIFAPSDLILNKFRTSNSPRKLAKINHGLAQVFCAPKIISDKNSSTTIGYVGNLTSQVIRLDLIEKIISQHPEIQFTLIGPIGKSNISNNENGMSKMTPIINAKNVNHRGALSPEEYQKEINKLDGFLVCYDGDPVSISNSHKILEYLSTGKVIFSGPIDEYIGLPMLVNSSSVIEQLPSDFTKGVKDIEYLNSEENCQTRISFANDNTYSKQIARIETFIYDSYSKEKNH